VRYAKFHLKAGAGEHVDKCVDAEQIDLAAHEVTDPRLGHAEERGGLGLGQSAILNDLTQRRHEGRANPEVLSRVRAKSQILEYIAAGADDPSLGGHSYVSLLGRMARARRSAITSRNRWRPRSRSDAVWMRIS